MKRILALNFFPAFVPVSNGGESKVYHFYKELSKHHYVTLLSSTYPDVPEEVIYHTSTFIERRIPKDQYFYKSWNDLSGVLSEGHGDLSAPAIAASAFYPTLMHHAYLSEYDAADIIVHDFPFTVDFDIFLGTDHKPRIYNSHNCETELYSILHPEKKSQPIVELVANAEKKLLEHADLILYCGVGDFSSFKRIVPHKESVMFYSPNGMTEQYRETTNRHKKDKHSVVFLGSGHLPNLLAAKYLVEKVAPQCPDITFDIVGNCLPEGKYAANVVRHGRVTDEEKVNIFERASLALNPMESGSGSNIKALDYFSFGLPILSTNFGMRGFNIEAGQHFILAELDQYAQVLKQSLIDTEFENTVNIGLAGKELTSESYTWSAIVSRLLPKLDELVKPITPYTLVLNDYNSFSGVGGGGTRTRGLYQAVNEISPVVFVCFSDDENLTTTQFNEKTVVISVPKTSDHRREVNEINSLFHISCDDIIASKYCTENRMLHDIYNILKKSARFIVVEHPYMTPLPIAYHDRFVYSSQNNETRLKTSLLQWHPKKDYLIDIITKVETHAVQCAAATVAVSDEDAHSLLIGKKTAGSMTVVYNGSQLPVAVSAEKQQSVVSKLQTKSAVFLGSAHMPNVEAVNHLLKEITPHCPDVQFHIMGSVCNAINVKVGKNVVLWGIVDEETKCAVLQNSLFAINPVNTGGGSNVKLADFFANGLFVVSTQFGMRGYPEKISKHLAIAEPADFAKVINSLSVSDIVFNQQMRQERKDIFLAELSMVGLATKFVRLLQRLEKPKKKILFVTYRYTSPELGGAESNLKRFLQALGETDEFDIDVVTTEVSRISNLSRFMDQYSFEEDVSAPVEMHNLRYARFPVDQHIKPENEAKMRLVWQVQPAFERAVVNQLTPPNENILAWGWGNSEGDKPDVYRWAYTSCAVSIARVSDIVIKGYAPNKSLITLQSENAVVYLSQEVEGHFKLAASVEAGMLEMNTSKEIDVQNDPRPLAFIVNNLKINEQILDLSQPVLADGLNIPADRVFDVLHTAAEKTRFPLGINLTDIRGPHSSAMESYIASTIEQYDLVVTHNSVFKPAVFAIDMAKQKNIPSLLIC